MPQRPLHMWKEDVAICLRRAPYSWGGCCYQLMREYNQESLDGFWSNGATPEDVAAVIHDARMNMSTKIKDQSPGELARKWGTFRRI